MFPTRERIRLPDFIYMRIKMKKAFTLLEILITIAIITIGIIAITRSFNTGSRSGRDIEDVDLALNIAQANMEMARNTPFENLSDQPLLADSNFPNFAVTRNVSTLAEGYKEVSVTVTWGALGGQTGITLTTLATDY